MSSENIVTEKEAMYRAKTLAYDEAIRYAERAYQEMCKAHKTLRPDSPNRPAKRHAY